MNLRTLGTALALVCLIAAPSRAEVLENAAAQAKVDAKVALLKELAADPAIVSAVAAQNAGLPPSVASMTQEKWAGLKAADPIVRAFTGNPAALELKAKKQDWASEMFLNDARGYKVAFLAKTTSWCHAGSDKHEAPMAGKVWQGRISVDQSMGLRELQVSVPVLSDGKPIGSLVVGIDITKL